MTAVVKKQKARVAWKKIALCEKINQLLAD